MQSQKNETNKRENIKENGKYQPFTYLPRKSFNQTFWKCELILEYSPTKVGFEKLRSEMISLLSRGEKSNHSFFWFKPI